MSTERATAYLSKAFGSAVRSLRTAQGISQEEFADLCGLDRTYISQIERGLPNPTIKTVWLLARALGKRPSELIARAERAQEAANRLGKRS